LTRCPFGQDVRKEISLHHHLLRIALLSTVCSIVYIMQLLEEWYFKNPIDPDSLEADVQDMAFLYGLSIGGLSINDPITDDVPASH
jgi:hypothetical protein